MVNAMKQRLPRLQNEWRVTVRFRMVMERSGCCDPGAAADLQLRVEAASCVCGSRLPAASSRTRHPLPAFAASQTNAVQFAPRSSWPISDRASTSHLRLATGYVTSAGPGASTVDPHEPWLHRGQLSLSPAWWRSEFSCCRCAMRAVSLWMGAADRAIWSRSLARPGCRQGGPGAVAGRGLEG